MLLGITRRVDVTSRGAFEYTVLSYRTVFGLLFLFGCHQVRCSGRREASGRFEARAPFVVGLRSSRLVLIVEAARWGAKSSVGVASVRSSVCGRREASAPRRRLQYTTLLGDSLCRNKSARTASTALLYR